MPAWSPVDVETVWGQASERAKFGQSRRSRWKDVANQVGGNDGSGPMMLSELPSNDRRISVTDRKDDDRHSVTN
eukprot:scaffold340_cov256-Pinguiococcus_pyrenoidosus.AAC.56